MLDTLENNNYTFSKTGTPENGVFEELKGLRIHNPKKVIIGHLNINSIPNKFEGIMNLVANNLDVFLISETKIDDSFPEAQFAYNGYSLPHRRDRALGAGGLLLYVNEDIPSKKLKNHILPDDIEILCVEINLKKQKWIIMGIYKPPNMSNTYFLEHLSKTIDCYSAKYDRLVVMGDFNLEPSTEIIETFCNSYDLYNLVNEKTCFKEKPKCYDLILTNHKNNFQNTSAFTTGFSDFHKMTTTILKTEYVKADPVQINYRDYKRYNPIAFRDELRNEFNENISINHDYGSFQKILVDTLHKHAPLKKKYVRANNSPFMTKKLQKNVMNISRCKNTYIKNKTGENWEKYRKLRNECVKETRKVKKEYYRNLNISDITDNKRFWKTIKPNFSNKIKTKKIILVENEEIISENKINAEIFNEYFTNVVKDLNIPAITISKKTANIQTTDHIEKIILLYSEHPSILKINEYVHNISPFSFNQIDELQIETEVNELNKNKAPGVDGIPPKILKESIDILKVPLTQHFNSAVENKHFPDDLKFANITPLFKKDDSTDKTNYRPISILPAISKIYERIMFKQMTDFIENKISQYLCGFRKGYNTQHALLRLVDKLNKNLDNNKKIGILMMDLSKAFDCISHDLLIAKLNAYGFSSCSLKLIYSYLKERKQRVKINSDFSTWTEIINGVPQGSVLGPLLFNIFINDIFLFVTHSDVINFADDNTLSVANSSLNEIISSLEYDIDNVHKWFSQNGMVLNEDKCQFMILESQKSIRNEEAQVNVCGKSVIETNKGKLLGITIDNHLSMKDHIKNICKQASNKLNALARIANYLDENKRKVLMNSFVISQFNYCPIIWMYCQRQSNNMINKIHERALRIAYTDYTSSFDDLLKKNHSVTIHKKNIQALALEIFKTRNDLNPKFMKNIFTPRDHNYSTRNECLTYPIPRTVTYGLESFGYRANEIWNSLPKHIQAANDVKTFKSLLSNNNHNLCSCNLCKTYVSNVGYVKII